MEHRNGFLFRQWVSFVSSSFSLHIYTPHFHFHSTSSGRSEESELMLEEWRTIQFPTLDRVNLEKDTHIQQQQWKRKKYWNESFYDFPSSWLIGNFRFRLFLSPLLVLLLLLNGNSSTIDIIWATIAMCCGDICCCYVWCVSIFFRYWYWLLSVSALILFITIFLSFFTSLFRVPLLHADSPPRIVSFYRLKAASSAVFAPSFMPYSLNIQFRHINTLHEAVSNLFRWFLLLPLSY